MEYARYNLAKSSLNGVRVGPLAKEGGFEEWQGRKGKHPAFIILGGIDFQAEDASLKIDL